MILHLLVPKGMMGEKKQETNKTSGSLYTQKSLTKYHKVLKVSPSISKSQKYHKVS